MSQAQNRIHEVFPYLRVKGAVKRSDEGVRRATGRDRDEWFTVLVTRVNVNITAGEGKSQAAVEHERLPDAETAERRKAFWRDRLTALKTMLEG